MKGSFSFWYLVWVLACFRIMFWKLIILMFWFILWNYLFLDLVSLLILGFQETQLWPYWPEARCLMLLVICCILLFDTRSSCSSWSLIFRFVQNVKSVIRSFTEEGLGMLKPYEVIWVDGFSKYTSSIVPWELWPTELLFSEFKNDD
jgi:hypothetical protein